MSVVQQYIPGNYNYVDVAANDIDYAVIKQGLGALGHLDRSKFTILDSSQNFTKPEVLHAIANSMDYCNIPGIVLGSDPMINTDRVRYFPFFAVWGLNAWQSTTSVNCCEYMYSCLNRNPHQHRIANWYALKHIPNGIWSMYNLTNYTQNTYPIEFQAVMQSWNQDRFELPAECDNDLHDAHPAYKSSYINLVTESVMCDSVFVSEKTWKPIANAQLFLVAGCYKTIEYLRSIGVDVFDDIIDHSYDLEPDWIVRLKKFQHSFKSLIKQDIVTIWQQTKDRRQQNAQKFFDKSFVKPYIDNLEVDH